MITNVKFVYLALKVRLAFYEWRNRLIRITTFALLIITELIALHFYVRWNHANQVLFPVSISIFFTLKIIFLCYTSTVATSVNYGNSFSFILQNAGRGYVLLNNQRIRQCILKESKAIKIKPSEIFDHTVDIHQVANKK